MNNGNKIWSNFEKGETKGLGNVEMKENDDCGK